MKTKKWKKNEQKKCKKNGQQKKWNCCLLFVCLFIMEGSSINQIKWDEITWEKIIWDYIRKKWHEIT